MYFAKFPLFVRSTDVRQWFNTTVLDSYPSIKGGADGRQETEAREADVVHATWKTTRSITLDVLEYGSSGNFEYSCAIAHQYTDSTMGVPIRHRWATFGASHSSFGRQDTGACSRDQQRELRLLLEIDVKTTSYSRQFGRQDGTLAFRSPGPQLTAPTEPGCCVHLRETLVTGGSIKCQHAQQVNPPPVYVMKKKLLNI